MAKNKEIDVAVAEVVDFMRITGTFVPALRQVVARKITAQAAAKAGIKVTTGELQRVADTFRLANGLARAGDTKSWLKSEGISLEYFENYLETNLLINKFKDRLRKKAATNKYMASMGIQESLNEMIYQDWLTKAMK
jgi:hypothetical protein